MASRPRSIGPYDLLDLLGQGGMGVVYRARHQELKREVALKLMRELGPTDEEARRRFDRESRIHLSLNHPNLVKVFDAGIEGDQPYMAMELVTGSDLRSVLDAGAPLDERECRCILLDLARGLKHLHDHRIVHRDLKPENILCLEDGVRKITDFGLSRRPDDTMLTEDGAFLGTLAFAAPEAVLGHPASPAGDLYAIGLIAYWMLTGDLPYRADKMEDWCVKIVNEIPRPPSQVNPHSPADLDRLVMSLLDKDPGDRPTAVQLLEILEGVTGSPPPRPPDRTEVLPLPGMPAPAPAASRRPRLAALVMTITCTIALLPLLFRSGVPPPAPVAATPSTALPAPLLGFLDQDVETTADMISGRGRTAKPVRLRVSAETAGEPQRESIEEVARIWHRHDLPAKGGHRYRIRYEAADGGLVLLPSETVTRTATTGEMKSLHRTLAQQRFMLPVISGERFAPQGLLQLHEDNPIVRSFVHHRKLLYTPAAEPYLTEVTAGQAYSRLPSLVHIMGQIGSQKVQEILTNGLDPSRLHFDKPGRYQAFYERNDTIVEALLQRGDEASLEAVVRFCQHGEDVWTPVIGGDKAPFVRLRALRLLATYRPDAALRLVWGDSPRDEECSAYLDAFLHAGAATLDRIHRSRPQVRSVTLAGLMERWTPPPVVTFDTDSQDWKAVTLEEWRLVGPLLAWQATPAGTERLIEASRLKGRRGRHPFAPPAGRFLGMSRDPAALAALLDLLESPVEENQTGALLGLAHRAAAPGLERLRELPGTIDPGTLDRIRWKLGEVRVEPGTRALLALCRVLWGWPGARETLLPLAREGDALERWFAAVAHALAGAGPLPALDPVTSVKGPPIEAEGVASLVVSLPALLAPARPGRQTRVLLLDPLPPWNETGFTVQVGDRIRVGYAGAARVDRQEGDGVSFRVGTKLDLPATLFWAQARIGRHAVPVDTENQDGFRAMADFVARDSGPLWLRCGFDPYTRGEEVLTAFSPWLSAVRFLALARVEWIPREDQPPGPSAPR